MASDSAIIPNIFEPDRVIAGFSTRHGGHSLDHLATLNMSYSVSASRETVDQNRSVFFRQFGITLDRLATVGQVHGTDVEVVTAPGFYAERDGLVTSTPGVALCITAADCAAVFLADVDRKVVGACHAGWRGAAGGIIPKTIGLMVEEGAVRESIQAFVSPCISVDHFEVGEEVARNFDEKHIDRSFVKPHVNLKGHIRDQLLSAGIAVSQIEVSPRCTFADSDLLYSHRAHKGKTGRMMGFIAIATDQASG